jgi:hypothetical protein
VSPWTREERTTTSMMSTSGEKRHSITCDEMCGWQHRTRGGVPGAKRAFRLGDGEFSLVLSGSRRGRMQNLDERRLRHGMFSE